MRFFCSSTCSTSILLDISIVDICGYSNREKCDHGTCAAANIGDMQRSEHRVQSHRFTVKYRLVYCFYFKCKRWGIRDASTKNHNVIQICLDEVRRCFETSPMNLPVLVHLAFDRYGWVPVPSEIEHDLFLNLIEETAEGERSLLYSAYVHDKNRSPEVHRLKSTDQLKNWSELEPKLRKLLEKSVLMKNKLK